MNAEFHLGRLGPVVSRKRVERSGRTPHALQSGDRLFRPLLAGMLEQAKREALGEAALGYLKRKQDAVRAAYFRQRYGRDYWTGARRHNRERDAWWNEGYQDDVEGRVLWRRPLGWSDKRWNAYLLGSECSRRDGRTARDERAA